MALKIEEIMDLSLDEYIAISKKSTNKDLRNAGKVTLNSTNDTKFGRRKGNIDDDEEDEEEDVLMKGPKEELEKETLEKNESGIWKGPHSSISYIDCNDNRNDLRLKLNKNSAPKVSSVQYRMMAPNNAANRPRGIPTLLPLNAQVNNYKNCYKGNKRGGGNHGRNNYQRNFGNIKSVFNTNNGFGAANGVTSGRVQRNRNQNFESKNFLISVAKNNTSHNCSLSSVNSYATAQNMLIETPSSIINLASSPPLNSSFRMNQAEGECHIDNSPQPLPIGNITPQAQAVLNLNSVQNTSLDAGSNKESLKNLLGFQGNVSSEMMPIFASRLMDFIQSGLQNPVVHKPIYDMKIQKDIHEIQKKPLLYKCPGGEVVSSDGGGVNCKITPRTSGMSLNCRFA